MILKLSDNIIMKKKLVVYFIVAHKQNKDYSFKNIFKYKVSENILYAKAMNSKLMLYKENGFIINYNSSKNTDLRFRDFSIQVSYDRREKAPSIFSKLMRSLSKSNTSDFEHVDELHGLSEFSNTIVESKFNTTTYPHKIYL